MPSAITTPRGRKEIERHGFTVIRFRNETVLNDRDAVIAAIREALGTTPQKPLR